MSRAEMMEVSSRQSRNARSNSSSRQRRSGYEPSDTEVEWQESPWHDLQKDDGNPKDEVLIEDIPKTPSRYISPLSRNNQRYSSNPDFEFSSHARAPRTSSVPRRNSKSPYKPQGDNAGVVSPRSGGSGSSSALRRNKNPLAKTTESWRQVSPYKNRIEESVIEEGEFVSSSRRHNRRMSNKRLGADEEETHARFLEVLKVSDQSNYSNRSVSAPKARAREKEQQFNFGLERRDRSLSPLPKSLMRKQSEPSSVMTPLASEVNELVAKMKLSKGLVGGDAQLLETTESITPGDIFFSREYSNLALQKHGVMKKNGSGSSFAVVSERDTDSHKKNKINTSVLDVVSSSTVASASQTKTGSNSTISRKSISRSSYGSSKSSDSFRKFTANRQKKHKDMWFGCVRKGPCKTSKSPERREFDEALFIEKASVVENLIPFWADAHQPGSLNGFTCNKQQAQLLKQLVTHASCPHILLKGPSGSGKKALSMALLHEIYGDPAWNISHDLRSFLVQDKRPKRVAVPVTSSPHHVELNLKSEPQNAKYAVMAIVKEMINNRAIAPEVSTLSFSADYKVIVLHEADKVEENFQHLIKWIMDCYSDACKFILCCEDDVDIIDSIKSRFKVISVNAPVTHEIMEVLIQIARKENVDLPMSFAAKIATKSKQNLRRAIMALEACKAHNYPFVDEQPIPLGWEEVVVELASETLIDPSPLRLPLARAKFQKLLVDFVHPKLILQKLVEQFLKGVEDSIKRQMYYWHAYYDKRLPEGTSALLKLEEFVAKFMSIYRRSFKDQMIPIDRIRP